MSRLFLLLQMTIVECRGACYNRDPERALGELKVAMSAKSSLELSVRSQVAKMCQDITTFSRIDNAFVKDNVPIYLNLVRDIARDGIETADTFESPANMAVYSLIDIGLQQLYHSLNADDLQRGEIEADHIHNLPMLVDVPARASSYEYYLNSECEYYLERLSKLYGAEEKENAELRFQEYWDQLKVLAH